MKSKMMPMAPCGRKDLLAAKLAWGLLSKQGQLADWLGRQERKLPVKQKAALGILLALVWAAALLFPLLYPAGNPAVVLPTGSPFSEELPYVDSLQFEFTPKPYHHEREEKNQ